MKEKFIIVFCTVPSLDVAKEISNNIVNKRLAACVNIVPGLISIYRWEGKVCEDNEYLLIIKSRESIYKDLEEEIIALHPYDVPEIISSDISRGSDIYLDWLDSNIVNK